MAQVDDARVRAALEAVLLAAAGLPPILWENPQADASGFCLVTRLHRGAELKVSQGYTRQHGMLQVECWGPAGQGPAPMELVAAQVKSLFTPDELLGDYVHVAETAMLDGMRDVSGTWWIVPVQVDWRVDLLF